MNINSTSTSIDYSKSHKAHNSQSIKQMPKESQSFSKQELNSFVNDLNNNPIFSKKLKFGFNDVSEIFYITIIDIQTDKVLKEYSKDEAINLAKKLDELSGIVFDQNA